MQTRREALVAAGLAKPGRGKFSTAAKAWLDEQRANGVKFSDDELPARPVVKREPKQTKTESIGIPDYIFPSDYRYPENEYRVVVPKEWRKLVSLRSVCDNCQVSLLNHACNTPVVYGSIPVTIERV